MRFTSRLPIFDMLVFGPLMIVEGQRQEHKYFRAGLTIAGLAMIIGGGLMYMDSQR